MRSLLRAGAVVVALISSVPSLAADQPDACVARAGELGGGKVVTIPRLPTGGHGVALHACGIVDAPPAEVWPVVRECEKWDQFMPGVDSSKVRSRTGNAVVCDVLIDVPFPLSDLRSVSNIVEIERPDGSFLRRSILLEGNYRHNNGYWVLMPHDNGSKTLVAYDIDFNPDTMVPDFVLRQVQSATAPELLESIRERVKQCSASAVACAEVK